MDLLDEDSIANCLENKDIDVIIHLAALNEIDSMKDPALALEVNTQGTYKLLNIANAHNVNRFIYFSTFHVYGETSSSVITEETPTRPFHPYAITHRAAEDIVSFFNHYHKMKTLIFRLSNGYGYSMYKDIDRWTLVFNDLCRQAV
jgi:UDP-glucose 4-epimerase